MQQKQSRGYFGWELSYAWKKLIHTLCCLNILEEERQKCLAIVLAVVLECTVTRCFLTDHYSETPIVWKMSMIYTTEMICLTACYPENQRPLALKANCSKMHKPPLGYLFFLTSCIPWRLAPPLRLIGSDPDNFFQPLTSNKPFNSNPNQATNASQSRTSRAGLSQITDEEKYKWERVMCNGPSE